MADLAASLLTPILAISRAEIAFAVAFANGIPEAPHWPREAWESFVLPDEDVAVCRRIFAARLLDGTIAGMIAVARYETTTELELLLVAPEQRRKGLGSKLSEHWIAWAERSGVTRAFLEVRASNTGAQALYRSLGFEEHGTRPSYYHQPPEDAVLMQRL